MHHPVSRRAAAGWRRLAVRMVDAAAARARRGPRSAPARHHPRGALDGLGAVAPVGDPDWIGLARRARAGARRQDPCAAARFLLRAQSGDAELSSALPGEAGRDRARHRDALPRALAFRRPGRARERHQPPGRGGLRLAQPRARRAGIGRPRQSRRQPRLRRRHHHAADRARPGADPVMDAAAPAAGERGHPGAPARSLSAHRCETRRCARGADPARAHGRHRGHRGSHDRTSRARHARRPRASAPFSPTPPAPRRASSPNPTGRASARSASSAGTRT